MKKLQRERSVFQAFFILSLRLENLEQPLPRRNFDSFLGKNGPPVCYGSYENQKFVALKRFVIDVRLFINKLLGNIFLRYLNKLSKIFVNTACIIYPF